MMVYQDAKDKYITAKIFFGDTSDNKLYVDADSTVQAQEEDVTDAFLKGVLVVQVGTAYEVPLKVDANEVTTTTGAFEAVAKA